MRFQIPQTIADQIPIDIDIKRQNRMVMLYLKAKNHSRKSYLAMLEIALQDVYLFNKFQSHLCKDIVIKLLKDSERYDIRNKDILVERKQTFDKIIDNFDFYCKRGYAERAIVHHYYALWLLKVSNENEAHIEVKKAAYNEFVDYKAYGGFEFFSFRNFSEHAIEEIRNNILWLSYPGVFNDPIDTYLISHNQHLLADEKDRYKRELLMLYQKVYDHLKVRCFVRTKPIPDPRKPETVESFNPKDCAQNIENVNPIMWAHYAKDHTGFCIKFRFPQDFVKNNDEQTLTWTRLGNSEYKQSMTYDDASLTTHDVLFSKSNIWRYEHEVRLIHFDPNDDKNYKSLPLPEGSIVDIYLGLRCSDKDREEMKLLLRNKNIHLYQMIIDSTNIYKLRAVRIM